MSTTVVRPEGISGRKPFNRTVGIALVGLAIAAGLGYAIANQSGTEVSVAQPNVSVAARADTKFHLQAAQQAGTFSRLGGEMGQIPAAALTGAVTDAARSDVKFLEQAAQIAAEREILALEATKGVELSRFYELNVTSLGGTPPAFAENSDVSGLFWMLNVTSMETALDKQSAQWDSRIAYLTSPYEEPVQTNQSGPR